MVTLQIGCRHQLSGDFFYDTVTVRSHVLKSAESLTEHLLRLYEAEAPDIEIIVLSCAEN